MKKKLLLYAIPIIIICLAFILPSLSDRDSAGIIAVSAKEAADIIN